MHLGYDNGCLGFGSIKLQQGNFYICVSTYRFKMLFEGFVLIGDPVKQKCLKQ